MSGMNKQHEIVGRYYDTSIFDYESVRLTKYCPVEFAITSRYLQRWVPQGAKVAEIGVGVGHYSKLLTSQGCSIHLVDVSERLLDAACARLRDSGLEGQIVGVDRASATDLDCLGTGIFDVVLMLGPLYHLLTIEERQRAV